MNFLKLVLLSVESGLIHGMARKAFPGPTRGRLSRGQVYSGENLPLGLQHPTSVCPAIEESSLVLSKARAKCPELPLHVKA